MAMDQRQIVTRRQRSARTLVTAKTAMKDTTEQRLARQIEQEEYGGGGDRREAAKMAWRVGSTRDAAVDVGRGVEHVFKWYLGGTHVAVYGDFNGWKG